MAEINRRPQQDSGFGDALKVGGAVAGGIVGAGAGGVGAIPGAAAGAGVGGLAGGIIDPAKPPPTTVGSESGAMGRRMQSMQGSDTLNQLQNAESSLASLPPELREVYAPNIIKARLVAQGVA